MKLLSFFIFYCVIGYCLSFAQKIEEEEEKKNYLSLNYALSLVPEGYPNESSTNKGHFLPGLGLDYVRKIAPRTELGLIIDLEFSDYIIKKEKDLERDHATIICIVGNYELLKNWNFVLGGGVEFDHNETFTIARIGTEYIFPLLPNNWCIPIGTFVDFKKGYDTWSTSIGLGKRF